MSYLNFIRRHIDNLIERSNWDCLLWEKSKIRYRKHTGKTLSYKEPKDLNEKLFWLTRYWRHPLKTKCADKYLVREYVREQGLEEILIPLIGVYETAEEINWSNLPNSFILKCNHGSGYNIICTQKSELDEKETKRQLNEWLNTDYYQWGQELHYKNISKRIVCEVLINNEAPLEYQFWCVNGVPESILVCRKNYNNTYDAWSYSINGEQLYERKGETENCDIEFCPDIETMLAYAKTLSRPFPFVRVDLYFCNERIYFAELTFTPSGNILFRYKDSFIERLGNKLVLPKKLIYK